MEAIKISSNRCEEAAAVELIGLLLMVDVAEMHDGEE
jgi:hypothetical protein